MLGFCFCVFSYLELSITKYFQRFGSVIFTFVCCCLFVCLSSLSASASLSYQSIIQYTMRGTLEYPSRFVDAEPTPRPHRNLCKLFTLHPLGRRDRPVGASRIRVLDLTYILFVTWSSCKHWSSSSSSSSWVHVELVVVISVFVVSWNSSFTSPRHTAHVSLVIPWSLDRPMLRERC